MKTILVIEDDEDIARNLKDLLESEGYAVEIAENGQMALAHLSVHANLPSLILLDLMMPVMDGYRFREVQEKDPRLAPIPVLIMTADGQIEAKKMRLGANFYLRKPLDIDALLSALAAHTG